METYVQLCFYIFIKHKYYYNILHSIITIRVNRLIMSPKPISLLFVYYFIFVLQLSLFFS